MASNLYDGTIGSSTLDDEEQQPPEKKNPFLEDARELAAAEDAQLRTSYGRASQTSPDRAAEINRIAYELGAPESMVARNYDAMRRRAEAQRIDASTKDTPALREWISEVTNASVAHDDVPAMGGMERVLSWARSIPAGLMSSVGVGGWGKIRELAEVTEPAPITPGPTFGAQMAARFELSPATQALLTAGAAGNAPAAALTPSQISKLYLSTTFAPRQQVPGLVTPGNVNLFRQPKVTNPDGSVSTVDSIGVNLDGREVLLPTVTPDGRHFTGTDKQIEDQAVAEYRRTGQHLGMFTTPEASTAYARQLHDAYARGDYEVPMPTTANRELAEFAAGSARVAQHLTEKIRGERRGATYLDQVIYSGGESIGAMIPAFAVGPLVGGAAAAGLEGPAAIAAATSAATTFSIAEMGLATSGQAYQEAREQGVGVGKAAAFAEFQGAVEMATEWLPAHKLFESAFMGKSLITRMVQQIAPEIATENIATVLQDFGEWAVLPQNKDRTLWDYVRERPSAAVMTTLSTLVAVGGTTLATHAAGHFMGQMGEQAQASRTLPRDPAALANFIEQATKDTGTSHIYAPTDSFTEYYQSIGQDPREAAAALTGDPHAYDRAVASNQDLPIPMAAYVTKIASDPKANAFFVNELRLDPEQANLRELEALKTTTEQLAKRGGESDTKTEAIREAVRGQLEAAGYTPLQADYQARFIEKVFGTLASRAGVDPIALFDRYGLKVRRPSLETLQPGEAAAPSAVVQPDMTAAPRVEPGLESVTAPEGEAGAAPALPTTTTHDEQQQNKRAAFSALLENERRTIAEREAAGLTAEPEERHTERAVGQLAKYQAIADDRGEPMRVYRVRGADGGVTIGVSPAKNPAGAHAEQVAILYPSQAVGETTGITPTVAKPAATTGEPTAPATPTTPPQDRRASYRGPLGQQAAEAYKGLSDEEVLERVQQGEPLASVEVQRRLNVDPITGLGNSNAFNKARTAADADPTLHLISFDINNFKAVNDTYGHDAGDRLLADVGAKIEQAAAEFGVSRVFRLGGDEFAVIAPRELADAIRNRAEELVGVVERLAGERTKGQVLPVGLIGGVGDTYVSADKEDLASRKEARRKAPNWVASGLALSRWISETTQADVAAESTTGRPDTEAGPDRTGAGERLPDRAEERADTGAARVDEGERAGDRVEPERADAGRFRAPGITPRGLPEHGEVFERQSVEDNQARLVPAIVRELERMAAELSEFPFQPRHWRWDIPDLSGNVAGGHAQMTPAVAGAEVYDDILAFSPVNTRVIEGERVPAKEARGTRAQVADAIQRALQTRDIPTNLAEGAVRVAELRATLDYEIISRPWLPHLDGIQTPRAFVELLAKDFDAARATEDAYTRAGQPAAEPSETSEAGLETADVSFDPDELNQPLGPEEDLLETGEAQPRLPGAEGVREQEVATPAVAEAPFALTPPTAKPGRASPSKLGELFQSFFQPLRADDQRPPVAALTGQEFGEGATEPEAVRDAAMAYYTRELQHGLQQVERPGFGTVQFTKLGKRKVRNTSANIEKLRLLPAVPAIIQHGEYSGRIPLDKPRHDDIVAFHFFTAPVQIADRTISAGVSVAEDAAGNKFYNVNPDPDALRAAKKARADRQIQTPEPGPDEGGSSTFDQSMEADDQDVNLDVDRTLARTDTPAFQKWFGDSQVVDEQGNPQVVYHGTTGDFTTFDRDRANVESDWGAGFYFSNTPEDVAANYATLEGPDLEQRIQMRVEQLEGDYEYDADTQARIDAKIAELGTGASVGEAAIALAREDLGVTHGGATVPVYVRIENPAIVGGPNETRLEMGEVSDEDYIAGEEPAGTLTDFVAALREVANEFNDVKIDQAIEELIEKANYESIGLTEAFTVLKESEGLVYATDDTGKSASSEIIRQALERTGFDGIIDHTVDVKFGSQRRIGQPMEGMHEETVHYIAFEPEQIKSAIGNRGTFDPRRASILEQREDEAPPAVPGKEARGSYNRQQRMIKLFEQANLSTFLHESGHFFFDILTDLASDPNASEQIKADMATLLKYVGHEGDAASWRALSIDEQRDGHELFARSFEQYLREGKAPSLEMQTLFSRFRAWLLDVYRSVQALGVQLSPEVQGVFDRMVATDEEIEQAEAARDVPPLFLDHAQAGVSRERFETYRAQLEDASRQAREKLEQKVLAEHDRQLSAEWKENRDRIETTVAGELGAQPVYRALAAMQRGTNPDGTPLVEGLEVRPQKLSRQVLVERFGAERVKQIGQVEGPYLYTRREGLDPALVAEMYGFSSADEMLRAVVDAVPYKNAVQAETDRRMREQYGERTTETRLPDTARDALMNDSREQIIRAELKMLADLRRQNAPAEARADVAQAKAEAAYNERWKEAETRLRIAIAEGRKQSEIDTLRDQVRTLKGEARGGAARINAAMPPAKAIRAYAEQQVAGTVVMNLRPSVFWSAARRAGREATDHAARQNFDGAIKAKQQELLNVALYREASRVLQEVEARTVAARDLGRGPARARLGLAGESYLDQVDGILDQYEFAHASKKVLDRRAGIRAWVAAQQGENLPVELPEIVLDDARRINYRELTVEQFMGVTDGLAQIAHLARLKNKLIASKKERDFDRTRDGIVDHIEAQGKDRAPRIAVRISDEPARRIESWFAAHTKLAEFVARLDGYVEGGPMWDAFLRPINEAGTREASMQDAAARRLSEILTTAYSGREVAGLRGPSAKQKALGLGKNTLLFIPAINDSLTREERLAVALNWGNEGNRQRLMESGGRNWNQAQIQAILNTLDARDLKFVQDSLDYINSYWDQVEAQDRRLKGLPPQKVEPASWTHPVHGEQRGGYYPIAYDRRLSVKAGNVLDASEANLQGHAAGAYPMTRHGYTKERAAKVDQPVRLELSVMYEHLEQVIHSLSHREMLVDVGRLMADRRLQDAIVSRIGDIGYTQMRGALQDVALGTQHATTMVDRAMNYVRSGGTLAGLGWNVWTAIQQPIGLLNGAVINGPVWQARGLARFLRDAGTMEWSSRWVYQKSEMMRLRGRTAQRDIAEMRSGLTRSGGWFDNMLRTVSGDRLEREDITNSYMSLIEIGQKMADIPTWIGSYEKHRSAGESEDRSVALADQAVLDAQSGGQIKDLASVQRGAPAFKLFTMFYSYGNLIYNQTARVYGRDWVHAGSPGQFAVNLALLYIAPAALTVALAKAFGKGDDKDPWVVAMGKEVLGQAMNMFVFVREFAGGAQALAFGPGSTRGNRGYEGPAGTRFISSVSRLMTEVGKGRGGRTALRAAEDTGAILFKLPLGQVQRTVDGFVAIHEGKTRNPLAIFTGAPAKKASGQ